MRLKNIEAHWFSVSPVQCRDEAVMLRLACLLFLLQAVDRG